jgi:iron complex outermembrane recepter protein
MRVTTDAGDLLGRSPSALGVGVQRRSPIVTDPRIRGSRVGQLAASGSHWVPARIDLDTALSKIDSRIVEDMLVVKGPYSVLFGPGLNFIHVDLLPSPRYEGPMQLHGATSMDYQHNGDQWYGRQTLLAGASNWGVRASYGHRTGEDYLTGGGTRTPASYNSRDVDLAVGVDITDTSSVEFNAIRLDQTDVEYPGQAFDMDYLVTDGYNLAYEVTDQGLFDRLVVDVWYNRTRFTGSAQSPWKRQQFPLFFLWDYEGFTDVDTTSTGFQAAFSWGDRESNEVTAGVDFRYVGQEVNEISSGFKDFVFFNDVNSPIPQSEWMNPGLFVEHTRALDDATWLNVGARVDLTTTDVTDDPAKLQELGTRFPQHSLAEILGTDQFEQNFGTWALYGSLRHELNDNLAVVASAGHAERPPSSTELYAAETFLFLLGNGMNIAVGDPLLHAEQSWQIDLGLEANYSRMRMGINGFHAWLPDYITFENLGVAPSPYAPMQVALKYVNTELAVIRGFESYVEYELNDWLTPFATLRYVDGRDLTRNGDFATQQADGGNSSERVLGLPRGAFSGVAGAASEPLPSIYPFETRLGLRVGPPCAESPWGLELSVRLVDAQNKVASSLLETPTPGFAVCDLRTYIRPRENLLVSIGVENLFNADYREHLDFRMPAGSPFDISLQQPGVNFYCSTDLRY